VARAGQLGERRALRTHRPVRGEDEPDHDHQYDERRVPGVEQQERRRREHHAEPRDREDHPATRRRPLSKRLTIE
jgi:hypothetical protein